MAKGDYTGAAKPVKVKKTSYLTPLTPDQVNQQAAQTVAAKTQPVLDAYGNKIKQYGSANEARQHQLSQYGHWQQDELNKAFQEGQAALNKLIATSGSQGQQSQDILTAALRDQGANTTGAMQRATGGAPAPPSDAAALLAGAAMNQGSTQDALSASAAAYDADAMNRRSQAATLFNDQSGLQDRRYQGQVQGVNDQIDSTVAQEPGMISDEANRLGQMQQNLAIENAKLGESKKSRIFQQWLSKKQLHQTATAESNRHSEALAGLNLDNQKFVEQKNIDWANIGLSQQKLALDIKTEQDQADATKSTAAKERAKVKGQAYANAYGAFSKDFMTPGKNEIPPGGTAPVIKDPATGQNIPDPSYRPYKRTFADALRFLEGQPGVDRSWALHTLAKSTFASWRSMARAYIRSSHNKGANAQGNNNNPGGGH